MKSKCLFLVSQLDFDCLENHNSYSKKILCVTTSENRAKNYIKRKEKRTKKYTGYRDNIVFPQWEIAAVKKI